MSTAAPVPELGSFASSTFLDLQPVDGWRAAAVEPGTVLDPGALRQLPGDAWRPLPTSGSLRAPFAEDPSFDPDAWDFWMSCGITVAAADRVRLVFEGLATLCEVWLGDRHLLSTSNMFRAYDVDLTDLLADLEVEPSSRRTQELFVRVCSLAKALESPLPRARWRTAAVAHRNLRGLRTTLLGRMPGRFPPFAVAGPWRPVTLTTEHECCIDELRLGARLDGNRGHVSVSAVLAGNLDAVELIVGTERVDLDIVPVGEQWQCTGSLTLSDVHPWWPHTHGDPVTYQAHLNVHQGQSTGEIRLKPIGFRSIEVVGPPGPGFALEMNGTRVFTRGSCWTPVGLVETEMPVPRLRQLLEDAREAGMNMLRVGGTMVYESDAFYALCDELGIMVWQDFMFANMDYPLAESEFRGNVQAEAVCQLGRLGHHPCLAVLCGNSEVQQQAAMLGLPEELWRSDWFDVELPALCAAYRPDVPYAPSSPSGGALPFHTDAGTSHYFGVGAYGRPLGDERLAEPWFATECLALACVPEPETLERTYGQERSVTDQPRFRERIPRDAGADWDFLDVTHQYLRMLLGVEPDALRDADEAHYLHALRVTTGEVMNAVQTSWRRTGARCQGALVWLHRDLWNGPGWGIVASDGVPKSGYYYLKRAWAPVALLMEDAGVNGLRMHIVNDRTDDFRGSVEVHCLRYHGVQVARGQSDVVCPGRQRQQLAVESVLGGFIDSSHAYKFGPPAFDVVVCRLSGECDGERLTREIVYHPLTRGLLPEQELGLQTVWRRLSPTAYTLRISTRYFAQSVALSVPGYQPSDNYFHLAPGFEKEVVLTGPDRSEPPSGSLRALNSNGAWPLP